MLDVEEANGEFNPVFDPRLRMAEPLPVALEAIADVHLPGSDAPAGEMDLLYVDILQFKRAVDRAELAYHANNFDLVFDQPIQDRADCRPLRVIVQSLSATEAMLTEAKIPYTPTRSIAPGERSLLFKDPAGNWVELQEHRQLM